MLSRSPTQLPVNPYQTPVASIVKSEGFQSQFRPIPFKMDQSVEVQPSPSPKGPDYQQFEQKLMEAMNKVIHDQFGSSSNSRFEGYKKPYSELIDQVPFPVASLRVTFFFFEENKLLSNVILVNDNWNYN